jgi:hypothetical protein
LEALFVHAEAHVGFGSLSQQQSDPRLRSHGCLSQAEQREISARALRDVVRPIAQQVLAVTHSLEQRLDGALVA